MNHKFTSTLLRIENRTASWMKFSVIMKSAWRYAGLQTALTLLSRRGSDRRSRPWFIYHRRWQVSFLAAVKTVQVSLPQQGEENFSSFWEEPREALSCYATKGIKITRRGPKRDIWKIKAIERSRMKSLVAGIRWQTSMKDEYCVRQLLNPNWWTEFYHGTSDARTSITRVVTLLFFVDM